MRFNPCRVFSLVATVVYPKNKSFLHAVSIPVGFSRSLRRPGLEIRSGQHISFNPCRVFSLVATISEDVPLVVSGRVSIPVGFSRSLRQHKSDCSAYCNQMRFNPCRVFSLVATPGIEVSLGSTTEKFQSLSGFLARCDF
jgi:hypothetical protein